MSVDVFALCIHVSYTAYLVIITFVIPTINSDLLHTHNVPSLDQFQGTGCRPYLVRRQCIALQSRCDYKPHRWFQKHSAEIKKGKGISRVDLRRKCKYIARVGNSSSSFDTLVCSPCKHTHKCFRRFVL